MVTLFFASIVFIEPISIVLRTFIILWAIVLIYFYYFSNRRILKIKYHRWIILFICSNILTCFLHIDSNFFMNLVMVIHIVICVFIFYGMHTENNRKRIHKEIFYFCKIIVYVTTILAVAGILLALFNIKGEYINELFMDKPYKLVIYENRLTGLYTNPNLLAFSAFIAIVACHILSKKNFLKHCSMPKISKKLLIICVVVNFISLLLSDSNGSLLILGLYVAFNIFYKLFRWHQNISIKDLLIRSTKFTLSIACIFLLLFSSRDLTQLVFSVSSSLIAGNHHYLVEDDDDKKSENNDKKQPSDNKTTFNHENKNIDSGRFRLLQESSVFISNHPLFGIGKENIVPYGDAYIKGGLHFSDFHNGYLTIIVSSGIVGFIMFIAFALKICRHISKSLFLERRDLSYTVFPLIFAFLCAYCVYATIEKALVYEQSFMVVMFWYFLGYATMFIKKYDHLDEKVDFTRLFKNKVLTNTNKYDVPTDDHIEE